MQERIEFYKRRVLYAEKRTAYNFIRTIIKDFYQADDFVPPFIWLLFAIFDAEKVWKVVTICRYETLTFPFLNLIS